MKMVQAIVRPEKLKEIEEALAGQGFSSLTEVRSEAAIGSRRGKRRTYSAHRSARRAPSWSRTDSRRFPVRSCKTPKKRTVTSIALSPPAPEKPTTELFRHPINIKIGNNPLKPCRGASEHLP